MKKNVLSLLPFIIFLFGVISCEEPEEVTDTNDIRPYINFQFNIKNNIDTEVNVRLMKVIFGLSEFNENIYVDEESYNKHINNRDKMLQQSGWEKKYPENDIYIRDKDIIDKTMKGNTCEEMDFFLTTANSLLVEIKFANGEVCYLAGWPEYYNDVIKLENVKKFGFAYDVPIDKKIDSYVKNNPSQCNEIFFFDESGNIGGEYLPTSYSMNITINSMDDIQLEIGELTKVEPEENGNEITE